MRIALVGAGSVSTQYLDTLSRVRDVSVVAVVDRNPDRAAAAAALLLPTPRAMASLSGLDHDTCDLVLNLTTPASHDQVTRAALERGLDVASEKPLTLTSAAADTIGRLAGRSGRTVVCAPDTVLGTGLQTARRVIDDGGIGRPVGAHAVMVCPGHERWHHRPEFFYRAGGGPLFDMGPYHLTALIQLLGAVRRVVGTGRRPRATRTIGRGPLAGTSFDAEVDTHETALLMHHDGAVSTLVMSFDSPGTISADLEIYDTEGSLVVPDPNHFGGTVARRRVGEREWAPVPVLAGYSDAGRGIGIVDLIRSRADGTPPRAGLAVAAHVVEIIEAVHRSAAADGAPVDLTGRPERPPALPGVVPW